MPSGRRGGKAGSSLLCWEENQVSGFSMEKKEGNVLHRHFWFRGNSSGCIYLTLYGCSSLLALYTCRFFKVSIGRRHVAHEKKTGPLALR